MFGYEIKIFSSITEISEKNWELISDTHFPFASHAFLSALEQNDCLGLRTGWSPLYITAWRGGEIQGQELQGAYISFLKTNSYGEYIFDFEWAQVHQRRGLNYYPKMTSAIPFAPVTGAKILLRAGLDSGTKDSLRDAFIQEAQKQAEKNGVGSNHVLFLPEADVQVFERQGFFSRHSFQYHWQNENYKSFDDFLEKFRSKRKKEIVRERRQANESGLQFERLTGAALTEEHGRLMFRFYQDTVRKMGGIPYLTEGFYIQVFDRLRDNILFVTANDSAGKIQAGALNFFGSDTLFGRNWGCLQDYRSVHFEVCYYQGIEFAIERGFKLFEAGAQGEHKFQRGFLPRLTYSAHQIKDPVLGPAIQDFCKREKAGIAEMFAAYAEQTPFARG